MVRVVSDVVPVRLDHVVVPNRAQADGVGILGGRIIRALHSPGGVGRAGAVIGVAATAVEHGRMNGGNADHVGAEVFRHLLDVLGQGLGVGYLELIRVDVALGRPGHHLLKGISFVGGGLWKGRASQRVVRNTVHVPVVQGFAQFATFVLFVRGSAGVHRFP